MRWSECLCVCGDGAERVKKEGREEVRGIEAFRNKEMSGLEL